MQRLCVYCGSSPGNHPRYAAAARQLAQTLTQNRLGLVYGGASVGLMGLLADTVLAAGGEVYGVIPKVLKRKEVVHPGLTELHQVDSMHERKALMYELADGFIALPGGFGTLDELFETLTWAQLGMHTKPVAVLDVDGYFESLLAFLRHSVSAGFVSQSHLDALLVDDSPERLLERFKRYRPMPGKRWLDKENI